MLVVATVSGTLVALSKTVTITVDGRRSTVSTLVRFGERCPRLRRHQPRRARHAGPGRRRRDLRRQRRSWSNNGRLLTLTIDGQPVEVWTTADTVEAALAEIGRDPTDYQLSADRGREIPLDGLALSPRTRCTRSPSTTAAPPDRDTPARTVGDLLAAQGITLGASDRVTPTVSTALTEG